MAQNQIYTFCNLKRCVGKNGNPYVGVTMEVLIPKSGATVNTTANGKTVATFNAPIRNRAAYIGSLCGITPNADAEGTSWARFSFWNGDDGKGVGSRLTSVIDKHQGQGIVLVVCGAIKVTQVEKAGTTYVNTEVSVDDFYVSRILTPKAGTAPQQNAGQPVAPQPGYQPAMPAAQPAQGYAPQQTPDQTAYVAYGASQDFVEISDDDDLPF